jgi:hypothetical protein
MAEYLDSGSNNPTKCLGYWFNQNVIDGIVGFYAQFGYYSYNALYPFGNTLRNVATAGNPVHIVLGSNKGTLKEYDLRWTFGLIDGATDASLTVMSFSNAEFHPKTVCVQRADGTFAAVVGSANLTQAGLGRNVEAVVSFDSATDGQAICNEIINAIRNWPAGGDGVYPISSGNDIDDLKTAKLIDVPQPRMARPGRTRGTTLNVEYPGTRVPLWRPVPSPPASQPPTPPVIPPQGMPTPAVQPPALLPTNRGPILWQKC